MADQLKLQVLAQLTESDVNEVHRYLDEQYLSFPKSYYSGKQYLAASEQNTLIADNVNVLVLSSEKRFTIKLGSVGATPILNSYMYVYTGDASSFFVSNPNSESIEIKVVTAKTA
jgi:hypothetical protein